MDRTNRPPRALLLTLTAAAWLRPVAAADWPQWRGPGRTGISPEKSGWPKGWPPERLWSKNVGAGCTSPIIAAGRVYVMGWRGKGPLNRDPMGADTVYCFDAATGEEFWERTYSCRYQGRRRTGDQRGYGGPSATPAFDAKTGRLYTLSVDGHLTCWVTRQRGRFAWSKNLYDEYDVPQRPSVGGGQRDFGFTSSPLIMGGLVVVEVGARDAAVMAFDKQTGRRVWASPGYGPAGHTSGPMPMTVEGVSCLATLSLTKLVVMRVDEGHEGQTIAEHPWQTHYGCNIASPAIFGSAVLLTADYNLKKSRLLEITLKGAREAWTSDSRALLSSPVIHQGRAYMAFRRFMCLDMAAGRLKWSGGSFGHGSCLVAAGDDRVIAFGNGRLALLDALPEDGKYRELSSVGAVVRDACYPHVALSDGIICCKDKAGSVVCYSVRPRP